MFKNKEGKVRSGWKIAIVTAAILSIIMVIAMVGSIAIGILLAASGEINLETLEISEKGLRLQDNYSLALMFVQEIVMILTPIITWRYFVKKPLSAMGLSSLKGQSKELLMGLLFGIVSITIVFCVIVFTGNAVVKSWTPQFSSDTIIYLILFILVGFAEEIYGRGFIMSILRQTRSLPVVIIVSVIIFALLHSGNSGIGLLPYINLALVGVLLAYTYIKSGSIWTAIGYHIAWNYFQGNVFGFSVSGINTQGIISTIYEDNNIINGGTFGPEGGLIVTVVILLGILLVNKIYKNNTYNFMSEEPHQLEQIDIDAVEEVKQ